MLHTDTDTETGTGKTGYVLFTGHKSITEAERRAEEQRRNRQSLVKESE